MCRHLEPAHWPGRPSLLRSQAFRGVELLQPRPLQGRSVWCIGRPPGRTARAPRNHHETHVSAFQDPPCPHAWFSRPHENARWPGGAQCPPCQGSQAPGGLTSRRREPRAGYAAPGGGGLHTSPSHPAPRSHRAFFASPSEPSSHACGRRVVNKRRLPPNPACGRVLAAGTNGAQAPCPSGGQPQSHPAADACCIRASCRSPRAR
jgi:hypothetical protein